MFGKVKRHVREGEMACFVFQNATFGKARWHVLFF